MWGWYTPTLFSGTPPPFVPVPKTSWPSVPRKTPRIWPLKPAPKIGWRGFLALVFMLCIMAGLVGGFLAVMVVRLAGG